MATTTLRAALQGTSTRTIIKSMGSIKKEGRAPQWAWYRQTSSLLVTMVTVARRTRKYKACLTKDIFAL